MIPNSGKLVVTTPSDTEIRLERVFDAPRHLVFRAYTEPALVQQWLGVFGGWTLPVCTIDLCVGGEARYEWRNADGRSMGMTSRFIEMEPDSRLVSLEAFDSPWYPGECRVTITFDELDGRTTFAITTRYESEEIRDRVLGSGMEKGVGAGCDVLEMVLRTLEGDRS